MTASRTRVPARYAAPAAAAVVLALAAGCGSAPPPSPPSGVDELVVPTPSPDPADFVDEVDNPWLPLTAGSVWTRRVTSADGVRTEEARVTGTRSVAGVTATEVRTARAGGAGPADLRVEWFAQDRGGNVWLLGEQGVWEAGEDGAEAGLAMPADPRRGDGFARWAQEQEVRAVVLVGEREASATLPAGRFTDLLETTWSERSDGADEEWTVWSASGVGEVLRQGPEGRVELVEHQSGE
ncbi:hypothetical protein [Nocardioides solisilvae]|uniref:hypothetical protein n=1 Tax=Nocardioides solisilvae TaxID=1542435 RepID=UPI000D74136B|nr:hypothetical protein [Nocardioides solisilvae]